MDLLVLACVWSEWQRGREIERDKAIERKRAKADSAWVAASGVGSADAGVCAEREAEREGGRERDRARERERARKMKRERERESEKADSALVAFVWREAEREGGGYIDRERARARERTRARERRARVFEKDG